MNGRQRGHRVSVAIDLSRPFAGDFSAMQTSPPSGPDVSCIGLALIDAGTVDTNAFARVTLIDTVRNKSLPVYSMVVR